MGKSFRGNCCSGSPRSIARTAVRERVVLIEPAREDVVIGFNPLLHDSPQHGYYKVQRATDIILRAWEA